MIDKSFYQAPQGMIDLEEPEVEIVIEDPESVGIKIGDVELSIEKEEPDFGENLAESMDSQELAHISGELLGDFEMDLSSRKDWIQTYVDGLELLGLKIEDRTEP